MALSDILGTVAENIKSTAQGLIVLAKGEGTVTSEYGGLAGYLAPTPDELTDPTTGEQKTSGFGSILTSIGRKIKDTAKDIWEGTKKATAYVAEGAKGLVGKFDPVGIGLGFLKATWPILLGLLLVFLII